MIGKHPMIWEFQKHSHFLLDFLESFVVFPWLKEGFGMDWQHSKRRKDVSVLGAGRVSNTTIFLEQEGNGRGNLAHIVVMDFVGSSV